MAIEPLQTHGKYTETWVPPASDRFAIYERSDESWLRPLGFGKVKRTLVSLYDVRCCATGDLIGYISQNPTAEQFRSMRSLRFPVIQRHDLFQPIGGDAAQPEFNFIELRISAYQFNRLRYFAWTVSPNDVPTLVRSGILTHGPDNKEKFLYERRVHMRYELGRMGVYDSERN